MKKILLLAISGLFMLTSCEDFLDSTNKTGENTSNFPSRPSDLDAEVSALYGVLNQYSTDPLQHPYLVYNMMSDDCNGGGNNTSDVQPHAIGTLTNYGQNLYDAAWKNTYVGIARSNSIIYSVDAFDWSGNESTRNQLLGEAYFMRGLFYLWGTQFWGDIPAYWANACPNPCPQQSAKDVIYPHILADFLSAYTLMQFGATTQGDGHATKGAAAGYLARAYMFYEGFYQKAGELAKAAPAAVELPEQEGATATLSKDQVVAALKDAVDNGGYKLIEDFRLLWQYTNELSAPDYPYVADLVAAGKYWAGNGNAEQMFQIQYGNMASWNGTIAMGFTNMTSLYCSLRCDDRASGSTVSTKDENGYEGTLPFGQGWGQGIFNSRLWDDWSNNDPRKKATILDAQNELQDFAMPSSVSEETGLYNKKVIACTCSGSSWSDNTQYYTWWGVYRNQNTDKANRNGNSFQGDHFGDMVLMRYADALLMLTELTGDAQYMNRVRARVGLDAVGYSWDAIKNERRFELAGEGLRFNDLRRWSGINGGESCEAARALERKTDSRIYYGGKNEYKYHHPTSSWAKRYAETDGFLLIPSTQINLVGDESVLKQNPGWGNDVSDAVIYAVETY